MKILSPHLPPHPGSPYFQPHNKTTAYFLKCLRYQQQCRPASSVTRKVRKSVRVVTPPATAQNSAKLKTVGLTNCYVPDSKMIRTGVRSTRDEESFSPRVESHRYGSGSRPKARTGTKIWFWKTTCRPLHKIRRTCSFQTYSTTNHEDER